MSGPKKLDVREKIITKVTRFSDIVGMVHFLADMTKEGHIEAGDFYLELKPLFNRLEHLIETNTLE